MSGVKQISKLTPIQVHPKGHSALKESPNIINQLKWIIIIGTIFGINRMFVLKCNKIVFWLGYLHSIVLISTNVYFTIHHFEFIKTASYLVYKVSVSTEFTLLACTAIILYKKKLHSLLRNITLFDKKLNINKDVRVTIPIYRGLTWIAISITYCVVEYFSLVSYFFHHFGKTSLTSLYLTLLAHDVDLLFFCTLLRTIMIRVLVIKAHIEKVLRVEINETNKNENISTVEELSKKAILDISSLHDAYVLLHKCSEQLNSIMSLPMILMLFTSGLSTTMLLKTIVTVVQTGDIDHIRMRSMIIHASLRCVKYTSLIIIPCYYSSTTTTQVSNIRTMLHDALNTLKLDKVDRRKIKAFFQMTRDDEFAYALWGVIRLNMSLPLSYLSLCTTYLVIVIQFSKFID